jgi:hypothetical protein
MGKFNLIFGIGESGAPPQAIESRIFSDSAAVVNKEIAEEFSNRVGIARANRLATISTFSPTLRAALRPLRYVPNAEG